MTKSVKNMVQALGIAELPEVEQVVETPAQDTNRFLTAIPGSNGAAIFSFSVRRRDGSLLPSLSWKSQPDHMGRSKTFFAEVWLKSLNPETGTLETVGKLEGINNRNGFLARCEAGYQIWKSEIQEAEAAQAAPEPSNGAATIQDIPFDGS